ncbi:hypothetical protein RRG08_035064 [Elysia crispata]|uniref:Uncharacterized protein n=1 Tax=Elysia crispata TaxID=231223 RepID=A0AAE0ZTA5_9GAST|nr:hypothetical protein RRG08_035064 [Elysia crispata]
MVDLAPEIYTESDVGWELGLRPSVVIGNETHLPRPGSPLGISLVGWPVSRVTRSLIGRSTSRACQERAVTEQGAFYKRETLNQHQHNRLVKTEFTAT